MTDRPPVSGEPHHRYRTTCLDCGAGVEFDDRSQRASTGAALGDNDLRWRTLIWLNHGHDGLYGDDGEMQCLHSPPTDFLRHPIDHIEAHLTHARLAEQEGDR